MRSLLNYGRMESCRIMPKKVVEGGIVTNVMQSRKEGTLNDHQFHELGSISLFMGILYVLDRYSMDLVDFFFVVNS